MPAPFLKHPKGIRDVAEWYMSTATRRDYVHGIFEHQCEIALANLAKIHAAVGDAVDAVFVCGTDFGTQTSTFCSVQTFRELYLPYYKRVNDWIHAHTDVEDLQALLRRGGAVHAARSSRPASTSSTRCSARPPGMEPERLKDAYGDRSCSGAAAWTRRRCCRSARPAEVRRQVLERCEVFSQGGGFVFNAIHNIQARTPVENIVAMIDAVHEFNGTKAISGGTHA